MTPDPWPLGRSIARHGVTLVFEDAADEQLGWASACVTPYCVRVKIVPGYTRAESVPFWTYGWSGDRYRSRFSLHREQGGLLLEIDCQGRGSFLYGDRSIEVRWDPVGTGPMHYLDGMGLALWLEQRGVANVHANVLANSDGAFALIGSSQVGKSTLTASLLARGFSFLSDDMLALHESSTAFVAYPSEPRLRLWPESLAACGIERSEQWPRVHQRFDKRLVPLESIEGVRLCTDPKPVIGLYLLERHERAGPSPYIEPVSPADGLMALIHHSVTRDIPRHLAVEATRFAQLSALVCNTPIKRLLIPSQLTSLEQVSELIERDLCSATGRSDRRVTNGSTKDGRTFAAATQRPGLTRG